MNVPQEDLNLWRQFFDTLRGQCRQAMRDIDTGNIHAARRIVEQTEDAARRMALRLDKAGADAPEGTLPRTFETPLELLDTPANRRYAEKLREAWEAGLAVDRERYGADIGTDGCAQVIEMVLVDVEEECFGAVGAGRE